MQNRYAVCILKEAVEISSKGGGIISSIKQISPPKVRQIHAQTTKRGGSGDIVRMIESLYEKRRAQRVPREKPSELRLNTSQRKS